ARDRMLPTIRACGCASLSTSGRAGTASTTGARPSGAAQLDNAAIHARTLARRHLPPLRGVLSTSAALPQFRCLSRQRLSGRGSRRLRPGGEEPLSTVAPTDAVVQPKSAYCET